MPARIVYTDLDGTMVGPRGSFWHAADGGTTAEPAAALLELHGAGIPLVLVSGRTHLQLAEAARIFAAVRIVCVVVVALKSRPNWPASTMAYMLPP